MRAGDQVVFQGYVRVLLDVPEVFRRGDVLVVAEMDDESVYRCHAVTSDGRAMPCRSDMVFAEETIPLNYVGLVPLDTERACG